VPEVVLQHALLDGHLRGRVQVLHLAAAAGAGVQAEMRAAGAHPLRGLLVDGRDGARLPVVLLAVHVDADHLERQRAFDEHHLAIGLAGNALGLDVEGGTGAQTVSSVMPGLSQAGASPARTQPQRISPPRARGSRG
jgi:hypothetical protein